MGKQYVLGASTAQKATNYLHALDSLTSYGGRVGQVQQNRPTLGVPAGTTQEEQLLSVPLNGVFTLQKYVTHYTEDVDGSAVDVTTYGIRVINDKVVSEFEEESSDVEYCGWIHPYHIPVPVTEFPCVEYRYTEQGITATQMLVPNVTHIIYLKVTWAQENHMYCYEDGGYYDYVIKPVICTIPESDALLVDNAQVDYTVLGTFKYEYNSDSIPRFEIRQVYTQGKEIDIAEGRWWY